MIEAAREEKILRKMKREKEFWIRKGSQFALTIQLNTPKAKTTLDAIENKRLSLFQFTPKKTEDSKESDELVFSEEHKGDGWSKVEGLQRNLDEIIADLQHNIDILRSAGEGHKANSQNWRSISENIRTEQYMTPRTERKDG
jgi:hypothetical protein